MFDVDTARAAIDMGDQQLLARRILGSEARDKEAARGLMAVEERR